MTLVKTSILSAISTVIRIISGFVINKVVAVYIGPSGLALIGQFQNFIGLILNISGNALSTAITKYTAEYHDDENKKYRLWSASFKIVLPISVFVSIFIFIFSNELSNYLFQSEKFAYILEVFAITIPIFLMNTLFMAILNGHRDIKKYIILNIISSIVSLVFVSLLVIYFALDGALLAYVLGQSIVLIVTLIYIKKESWLKIDNFTYNFQSDEVKKLFGFAVITFTSVSASSIMMLVVRDYLTQNFSAESAGYWQGIWSLSQVSLSLITMSLSTYLLPTLSGLKDSKQISIELQKAYLLMIPVAISISLFAYLLREPIILILFTEKFMPMEELFAWQFVGNVIKVAAWLLGYLVVAKAMIKTVVVTEVIFAISFIVFTILLTDYYGLIGVTQAYTINSFLHLLTMIFVYHTQIKKKDYSNE